MSDKYFGLSKGGIRNVDLSAPQSIDVIVRSVDKEEPLVTYPADDETLYHLINLGPTGYTTTTEKADDAPIIPDVSTTSYGMKPRAVSTEDASSIEDLAGGKVNSDFYRDENVPVEIVLVQADYDLAEQFQNRDVVYALQPNSEGHPLTDLGSPNREGLPLDWLMAVYDQPARIGMNYEGCNH